MESPKRLVDFDQYANLLLEKAVAPDTLYRKKYRTPSSGHTWSGVKIEFVTDPNTLKTLIPNGSTVVQADHFPKKPVDSLPFSDPKVKGAVVYTIQSDNDSRKITVFMRKD